MEPTQLHSCHTEHACLRSFSGPTQLNVPEYLVAAELGRMDAIGLAAFEERAATAEARLAILENLVLNGGG